MNMEAYVFAGAIYWFSCFGLSQWSRLREKRLQVRTDDRAGLIFAGPRM